jgi:hypothetical protein
MVDKDSPIAGYIFHTDKGVGKYDTGCLGKSANYCIGTCILDKREPCPYNHTEMAKIFPTLFPTPTSSCRRGLSIGLINGDRCRVGNWVLFKSDASGAVAPKLGHVKEIVILTCPTATSTEQLTRTVVLLQHMDIGACVEPYQMPAISFGNQWVAVDVSVSDR